MANNWSYEETLLAFILYCQIPFGHIHHHNPEIINLSKLLNRTASAVAMKMVNLASLDPALKERGIKGLSNASKMEKKIWDDFHNSGISMVDYATKFMNDHEVNTQSAKNEDTGSSNTERKLLSPVSIPQGSSRLMPSRQRVGQTFFRRAVLAAYNGKCCITGITVEPLLIASHIKPWAESDDRSEKTNPCNGLCLNALHDKAFDQGLITINHDYRIQISRDMKSLDLDEKTIELIIGIEGKAISLPDRFYPDHKFIEYHNKKVFLG